MDPVTLGVVALMGAVATIGGAAEDLESDMNLILVLKVTLTPKFNLLHKWDIYTV